MYSSELTLERSSVRPSAGGDNRIVIEDNSNLNSTQGVEHHPAQSEAWIASNRKVQAIFSTVMHNRAQWEERASEKRSMSFVHISSSGSKTRLAGAMSAQADSLLELTIDMKYLILQVQGIQIPKLVDDFQIHLEDHTCTYTHPDTKKKLIFQLHDIPNKQVQELTEIYFDAARPIFVQRYHFDRAGSPINGMRKLPPNPGILKVTGRFIHVSKKGFDRSTQFVASYFVTAQPGPIRDQILKRFTFTYLMHKGLVEKLDQRIKEKETALAALGERRAVQNEKKKRTEQLLHLRAMKNELEEMDYFAPSLVLSNFPVISPEQAQELAQDSIDQMELTLAEQIKKRKKVVEGKLRDDFKFANADKKDQAQLAYEEHYIRNNCLGLFNLTPHTQLPHTRQHSLRDAYQLSIENIFVRDALTYDRDYDGQGFKEYYWLRLGEDTALRGEVDGLIEGAARDVQVKMNNLAGQPRLDNIQVPPYFEDNPRGYTDIRDDATQRIENYLTDIEQLYAAL